MAVHAKPRVYINHYIHFRQFRTGKLAAVIHELSLGGWVATLDLNFVYLYVAVHPLKWMVSFLCARLSLQVQEPSIQKIIF